MIKRLFRIFELTTNEQRVVVIVIFILITIAFVTYERRLHPRFGQTSPTEPKPSPSVVGTADNH
jgi:hypothetical protein